MVSTTPGRPRIGLFVDSVHNPYSNELISAFEVEAERRELQLLCFVGGILVDRGVERMHNMAFELASPAALDAICCCSLAATSEQQLEFLSAFEPLPMCGIAVDVPGGALVNVDNATGVKEAVRHLHLVHGRVRLACLTGPLFNIDARERLDAYRAVLEELWLEYDPRLVVESDYNERAGHEAMNELMHGRGIVPDGLIAGNDFAAYGALQAALLAGMQVPRDLSIIGFDDSEVAKSSTPSLATIRQPYFEQASAVLDMLCARIQGRAAPHQVRVPTHFIRRRSCGCMSEGAPSEAPPAFEPAEGSFVHSFATRRPSFLSELRHAETTSRMLGPEQWTSEFVDELMLVLEGKNDGELLARFEDVLMRTIAVGGDLLVWHRATTGLRRRLLPCVMNSPALWLRLENLWQRLHVLITDSVEREQRNLRLLAERSAGVLTDASESLITSFNVDTLPRALADRLPSLDIPSAYVAVYDDAERPKTTSRLIVAYENGRLCELPSDGLPFPTLELLPERFRHGERRSLLVQALFFEQRQIGFVLFELGAKRRLVCELLRELISAALQGARLVKRVADAAAQQEKAEKERLEQELSIASRIQTSILPRDLDVAGLSIAAMMIPASEVGGDYYDVLSVDGGCWIGIGDVAGHGLRPGLVMMMLQSVVAAIGRHTPNASPSELLGVVNAVLYDNVRQRLNQDEHATLSLIRYDRSGELVFAGAHEDLIVHRARSGECELVQTLGTWVGATSDIQDVTIDGRCVRGARSDPRGRRRRPARRCGRS
ncbi:MAG TPA: substrate-binding domain-containing protein, partial [Polyangiaceae bacterium]|nr:substrate-binding domain-containing protein [Polyangiaceae bacterium]